MPSLKQVQGPLTESILIANKPFTMEFQIKKDKGPTDFILKELEDPIADGLLVQDWNLKGWTTYQGDQVRTWYSLILRLETMEEGEASLSSAVWTLMDASGAEEQFSTPDYRFQIVPWYQKHFGVLVGCALVSLGLVFGFKRF